MVESPHGTSNGKANVELALSNLARELGIDLIELSAIFESAAACGEMIYDSLDTHRNADGLELAARYTADTITSLRERSDISSMSVIFSDSEFR